MVHTYLSLLVSSAFETRCKPKNVAVPYWLKPAKPATRSYENLGRTMLLVDRMSSLKFLLELRIRLYLLDSTLEKVRRAVGIKADSIQKPMFALFATSFHFLPSSVTDLPTAECPTNLIFSRDHSMSTITRYAATTPLGPFIVTSFASSGLSW